MFSIIKLNEITSQCGQEIRKIQLLDVVRNNLIKSSFHVRNKISTFRLIVGPFQFVTELDVICVNAKLE